jgi:hypothetical protein
MTSHTKIMGEVLEDSPVSYYSVCAGVTKSCRLSWLTKSALFYEPKCGVSANE